MRISREDRLFAGALWIEHKMALLHGESLHVGVGCNKLLEKPPKPMTSFGFAGALTDSLSVGDTVVASKVVDEEGNTLFERELPGPINARQVVVLASNRFIDCPKERARIHKKSGAEVVDMETGYYVRHNLLQDYARVISDTPKKPIGSVNILTSGPFAFWALSQIKF